MAKIVRFKSMGERMLDARIETAEQLLLDLDTVPGTDDGEAVGRTLSLLARKRSAPAPDEPVWKFVMLGIEEGLALDTWLHEGGSKRPALASRVLLYCEAHCNRFTGEVMLRRNELAEMLKVRPGQVSTVFGDLERGGALRRVRAGGRVRVFLNSRLACHLPELERAAAQAADGPVAAQLSLVK